MYGSLPRRSTIGIRSSLTTRTFLALKACESFRQTRRSSPYKPWAIATARWTWTCNVDADTDWVGLTKSIEARTRYHARLMTFRSLPLLAFALLCFGTSIDVLSQTPDPPLD